MHLVHAEAPASALKVPAGQDTQLAVEVAPTVTENLPEAHPTHVLDAPDGW